MPNAEIVKVLVEHYGWPIVTVVVLGLILWRVMVKHEGQMAQMVTSMSINTEVNERVVANLDAVARRLAKHDRAERRRHRRTQERLDQES